VRRGKRCDYSFRGRRVSTIWAGFALARARPRLGKQVGQRADEPGHDVVGAEGPTDPDLQDVRERSVGGGLPALRCVYIPRLFGEKHRSSPAPELEPASKREGLAFSRRLEVLIEDREPGVVLSLNAQPQAPVRRAVLEDEVVD